MAPGQICLGTKLEQGLKLHCTFSALTEPSTEAGRVFCKDMASERRHLRDPRLEAQDSSLAM